MGWGSCPNALAAFEQMVTSLVPLTFLGEASQVSLPIRQTALVWGNHKEGKRACGSCPHVACSHGGAPVPFALGPECVFCPVPGCLAAEGSHGAAWSFPIPAPSSHLIRRKLLDEGPTGSPGPSV